MAEESLPQESPHRECHCGEIVAEELGNPKWIEFYRTYPIKVHHSRCPLAARAPAQEVDRG